MTERQRRFCDEYLRCLNATDAAVRAGYKETTARSQGSSLMKLPAIKAYIDERMKEKDAELVASQDEVLSYLTKVMRGQTQSEVIVVDDCGARHMSKAPDEKERLKAAELLGKCHGIFNDKLTAVTIVPVFKGEDRIED